MRQFVFGVRLADSVMTAPTAGTEKESMEVHPLLLVTDTLYMPADRFCRSSVMNPFDQSIVLPMEGSSVKSIAPLSMPHEEGVIMLEIETATVLSVISKVSVDAHNKLSVTVTMYEIITCYLCC